MKRSEPCASYIALTLRELLFLIVVLVCAVLLLWPYLSGKRNRKERVMSFRNLQQWGIALNLHLVDNDNQIPSVGSMPIGPEPADAWYNILPTYIARDPLGSIPAGELPKAGAESLWIDPSAELPERGFTGYPFFTYGMNLFLQPDSRERSYALYDLALPGSTIFLAETAGSVPWAMPETVEFRHAIPEAGSTPLANVLFCDGHVAPASRYEMVENPAATEPVDSLAPVTWVPYFGAPKPTER